MAVAYDNTAAASGYGVVTLTTPAFTIAGTNRVGIIALGGDTTGISAESGSIGGAAVSAISSADAVTQAGSRRVELWGCVAPATGSQTATMSWTTSSSTARIMAVTFEGAAQSSSFINGANGNAGWQANVALQITSTSGNLTVSGAQGTAADPVPSSDQTSWADGSAGFDYGPGTGTTTHTWTIYNYCAVAGCDIVQAGGATELVVSEMNIGCTLESPVLSQLHNLIVAGVDVGLTLEAIILSQLHNLSVDGVNVGLTLESPVLTQLHNLIADSMNIGLTLESPVLGQLHVLTVNGANIGLSLESPSLTQLHVLVVDSIDVGLVLESPVLSIGVVTLVVSGLNVGLTLESPGLTQLHNLTVQDVMIALNLDNVILVTESLVKLGIDSALWASKHRGPKQITKLSKTGIGMKKAGYPKIGSH